MRSLAIIPARGGSKRVPGKNLCDVGGRTLLDRALDSAAPCARVVVSSDDDNTLTIAASRGAATHKRYRNADDAAALEPVIDDVLLDEQLDGYSLAIVLLQPTSPFRTHEHVAHALALLAASPHGCVVSVTHLHSLLPVFSGEVFDGSYYPRNTTGHRRPSSSLGHLAYENGAIYAFTLDHWRRHGKRLDTAATALSMHWSEAVEIDTMSDLESARRMAGERTAVAAWLRDPVRRSSMGAGPLWFDDVAAAIERGEHLK